MAIQILCRADGNSEVGLGHMYRMFSIIEFYKEHFNITFLTRSSSTLSVIPKEYTTVLIPEEISLINEAVWLKNQYNSENVVLIADGYQFTSPYQKQIKSVGFKLVYIDDLMQEQAFADVVVNHSPFATKEKYDCQEYTQLALGTSYAMLRPTFNQLAKAHREITLIEEVFVCFGGSDMYDLSYKATEALLEFNSIKKIHIVLGGAYNHKKIYDLEKTAPKVALYSNLSESELSNIMLSCQFAIAPSSTILYELCAVKMPVLSGYYVDNQKYIYQSLTQKDIVFKAGDFSNYTKNDFKLKIKEVLDIKDFSEVLRLQSKLIDGKSKQRFLGLINSLLITFRKAKLEDAETVYNWSNDPLVRSYSYNSEPIIWENHLNWFKSKIGDKNTLFLISEVNGVPAGIVRYEIGADYSVVGILIGKAFRGQKLSEHLLKKAAEVYFEDHHLPIIAYIKKENIASIKAFTNANYKFLKEEVIKEISSFVYKLEK